MKENYKARNWEPETFNRETCGECVCTPLVREHVYKLRSQRKEDEKKEATKTRKKRRRKRECKRGGEEEVFITSKVRSFVWLFDFFIFIVEKSIQFLIGMLMSLLLRIILLFVRFGRVFEKSAIWWRKRREKASISIFRYCFPCKEIQ